MKNRVLSYPLYLLLSVTLLCGFSAEAYAERSYDHTKFNEFLGYAINEKGQVNFQKAKEHQALLQTYLEEINAVSMNKLKGAPREQKLALWINAYHAGLLNQLLKHHPLKSINDIPGLWESSLVNVAGQSFSLNHIRDEKLLRVFRDEKIHLALACGAKSCPGFKQEAYSGKQVEGQLYKHTRAFVNDQDFIAIDPDKKSVKLSRLFKWYASDFKLDFGTPDNDRKLKPEEAAVLAFVAYYTDDQDKVAFLEEGKYKIKYFSFDWSVNEWHTPVAS